MDVLLSQEEEDPAIRTLALATLNDEDLLSVAALFWTQLCWIWALAASGWLWLLPLMAADLVLFGLRWKLRRGTIRWSRSAAAVLPAWVNLALVAVIASEIAILLHVPARQTVFLGCFLAIGFSGYVSAMFAAFPVLATLNITVLNSALGLGLATGVSDDARPLAILSIGVGLAFWLLMRHSHVVLLGTIRAQHASRRLALHDPLTKLPNRVSMRETLAGYLAGPAVPGAPGEVAVLCLDLDGFKAINDRHGHAAGDWVLTHVGDLLRRILSDGGTASRIGGDEFVVLLPGADASRARMIAATIIAAVAEPFDIGRTVPARVGVSIGGALSSATCRTVDDLLEAADAALYHAKRTGKMRFCLDLTPAPVAA